MLWLDGALHQGTTAPFDLGDRGLTLSDGVFDTMLVSAGVPLYRDFHVERLLKGAAAIRIDVARERVEAAIRDLVAAGEGDLVVRVTVTRGGGARGLRLPAEPRPTVFASAAPWSPQIAFAPLRLATSRIRRNASSPLSRLKSLAYLDNVLALDEAVSAGADDALILSTEGRAACTSAGNLFAVMGGQLVTPPVSDGVLDGTIRQRLLARAGEAGLDAREASIDPAELASADAIFVTNSARLACPVTEIDGQPVGNRATVRPIIDLVCRDIADEGGRDMRAHVPG